MKQTLAGLVLVILLIGLIGPAVSAQEPPPPQARSQPADTPVAADPNSESAASANAAEAGIESIAGSTVTGSDNYVPGATATLCFTAFNASPDTEWLDAVGLVFPTGWTVACNSQDATDSGGHAVAFSCTAVGNAVDYADSDGSWGEVYDGCSWGFCVDVTAPGAASGDQTVDWSLSGDVYGADPHDITGQLTIEQQLPLNLDPSRVEVVGCNGVTQTHSFDLENNTGSAGTFNLAYDVPGGHATIDGPATLPVGDGSSASFDVELVPELCLPAGLEIVAVITATGNSYTDTSIISKTISTGMVPQWQSAANTPQGTRYHAVAYHNGYLYQIGGETDWWVLTGAVQRYDVAADSWTTMTPMGTSAYGIDAAAIGGNIYVPGGSDDTDDTGDGGTFLNTLQVYSTTADSWSTAAAMPTALAYASAVAYNGKLYVIGGEENSGNYVDTLYIYDPATDSWSTGASMSESRGYAAAAAIGGKIYVAGGFVGGSTVRTTMEIYDPAMDSWSAGPTLPKAWAPFGDGVLVNRYFVVFNGDVISYDTTNGTTYTCSQDAYAFDTVTQDWVQLPQLNRCLYGSQGATAGTNFYLVSGRTNEGGVWHMAPEVEYVSACPICPEEGWLEGYVYDYDGASRPCQDATVHVEPGGLELPVDPATGYYFAALTPWDYDVMATAIDYPGPAGPYAVTIIDGVTTTQDFVLDRPDAEVAPLALSATANAPGSATRFFTITNSGSIPLEWEILEAEDLSTADAASANPEYLTTWLEGSIDVEPQVYEELREKGATDFYVQMRLQADLSPAYGIDDWSARGWYVYDALKAANEAQAPVIAYAESRGLSYHAYLINNDVLIRGGSLADVAAMAARSDVNQIRAVHYYELEVNDEPAAPTAWQWNLDVLDPDASFFGMEAAQVWQEFGVTGDCPGCGYGGEDSIVVANIDTGVYYEHEALVRQYRGNLGGGSFEHNYNWYQPFNVAGTCGDGTYPCDWNRHGSGTAGIMVGETADMSEQVGIAPGAQWIACMGCDTPPNGCSDAALNACMDWMVAPTQVDGSAPDPDMRPHIVNNSWGGPGCDTDHQAQIQAWVAAGIFPAFSAGNTEACSAVGSPGDNPEAFGTAAHDDTGDNLYAGGPSCFFPDPSCDPEAHEVDPHLNAPTFGRTSGNTAGSYYNLSGTSGASPHTAGCVALIWAANPGLIGHITETYTILEQTADRTLTAPWNEGGCGKPTCAGTDPYPNYEYGWGYLDCYAAVESIYAADVPWVSTDPVSGTLPSGDQVVQVDFTCDYTQSLKPQPLQGSLRVLNNDPCNAVVEIDLEFFCIAQDPIPTWDKQIWVNGLEVSPVQGPHTVRPGDVVTIVDWVGATFSETITAALVETWSDSLELVDYDTAGVGTVTMYTSTLQWDLVGVAPNRSYPITKTFDVLYGDWRTDWITETYFVEGALQQLPAIVVAFEHYEPVLQLFKTGPVTATTGDFIPLLLTIHSDGNFRGTAVLTDILPAGMVYAGNISTTHGEAWEDSNVVYWHSYTTTQATANAPAATEVLVLTPDVGSGGGDITSLLNALATCSDINVTVWDPDTNGEPGLSDLLAYQVVVLGNDILWNNMDKTIVGDNLADYIDAGGKVIEGLYVQSFDEWGFAGRYMTGGYSPFTPATLDNWNPDTMNILNPAHPIMAGVTSVGDNWGHQNPGLQTGADLIAGWTTSGYNYIAVTDNVVALNQLLHHQADWTGDVPQILCNSIDFLMAGAAPPMPAKITIGFDVEITAGPGTVIRNLASLVWESDWTQDIHDVTIPAPVPPPCISIYLPVVFRGYSP